MTTTTSFDESKFNRSAVTGKFEDKPEQGLGGELTDEQIDAIADATEQEYLADKAADADGVALTFLGRWDGDDLVIDTVLLGDQDDDRVEGVDGNNLWCASGSGKSIDHVAQDLRREYEAGEIRRASGIPFEDPEPLAGYAETLDADEMRLLTTLIDPDNDVANSVEGALGEFEEFTGGLDRDHEIRLVADALSSARERYGATPNVEGVYDSDGAQDGYEIAVTIGSGSYRVFRDSRDLGDPDLTGVPAALAIAADVEREFDAIERQARLLQPTVADMRRTVTLADAMSVEKRVAWIGPDDVQREGTLRRGAWHGLSGTPEIAQAGTDPRTAGVRITLSTGMDIYVPWNDLDDALREDRLALD